MSDGIPWSTARTAIRGWIVAGATPDIAANHVIWAGQQKAVPDGMYITIDLEEEQDHGFDAQSYADVAGVVTQHAIGPRTVTIVVIVYGGVQQNDATVPYQIASRIRSRISLSAVNDALSAANVGILNWTSVTTPGRGLNSSVFEPRAMFSVDISLISDVSAVVDVISIVGAIGKTIT